MAKLKKETALRHADNATEIFVKFLDTDRQVRAIQVDKDDAAFAPMIAAYKQAQDPEPATASEPEPAFASDTVDVPVKKTRVKPNDGSEGTAL